MPHSLPPKRHSPSHIAPKGPHISPGQGQSEPREPDRRPGKTIPTHRPAARGLLPTRPTRPEGDPIPRNLVSYQRPVAGQGHKSMVRHREASPSAVAPGGYHLTSGPSVFNGLKWRASYAGCTSLGGAGTFGFRSIERATATLGSRIAVQSLWVGRRYQRRSEDDQAHHKTSAARTLSNNPIARLPPPANRNAMTVGRLFEQLLFRCVPMKRLSGPPHPDRDRQFRYIQRQKRRFAKNCRPSVDTKNTIGNFKNGGRLWREEADAVSVRPGV